jgi:ribosomal protein S18 acetylase RimI-like enzyme
MNHLTLRPATEQDIPAILNLYRAAGIEGEDGFTPDEALAHFALLKQYPYLRLVVAVAGEAVVGTYELAILDKLAKRGRKSGVVESVAVHPEFQGQGIGRAMMQHALEQCRLARCYKLALSSNLQREGAHRFYDSLGFTRHGYSFQVDLQE